MASTDSADAADDLPNAKAGAISPYVPETRTVIVVWMMVSTFIIIMSLLIWGGPKGDSAQLLNTLLGMYVGTGLITSITWWMGSAKGSDANNKMQEKLSEAATKPLALVPAPVAVAPTTDMLGASMLSNGQLKYFQSLTDEEAKKAFLGASATERDAIIAKAGT